MSSQDQIALDLAQMAKRMRRNALEMTLNAGSLRAHIASALSSMDILAVLYGKVMKIDAGNPLWEQRDRFILSKGHGSLALYAALAEAGLLSKEDLATFQLPETALSGHPTMNVEKGIEITSGSLGHGLSIGVGIALAGRLAHRPYHTYVLMGDGESNEGSVWEAAMAGSHFKLNRLTAIIDCNGLQSDGLSKAVMDMGSHEMKWQSFGWEVRAVDGHDLGSLTNAFTTPRIDNDRPLAIIARTTKGKGVSFMENNNQWHHNQLTKDQYTAAVSELVD